jgi:hypothetical protein
MPLPAALWAAWSWCATRREDVALPALSTSGSNPSSAETPVPSSSSRVEAMPPWKPTSSALTNGASRRLAFRSGISSGKEKARNESRS